MDLPHVNQIHLLREHPSLESVIDLERKYESSGGLQRATYPQTCSSVAPIHLVAARGQYHRQPLEPALDYRSRVGNVTWLTGRKYIRNVPRPNTVTGT